MQAKQLKPAIFNHEHLLDVLTNKLFSVVFYQVLIDTNGNRKFLFISNNIQHQIGYTSNEILANASLMYNAVNSDFTAVFYAKELHASQNLLPLNVEFQFKTKGNTIKWLQVRSVPTLMKDGAILWDGVQTDITDIKENVQKLYKANRELAMLNKINDKILSATNMQLLYDAICRCIVKDGDYILAWITEMPLPSYEDQIIRPIAKFGATGYLDEITIDLANPDQKNGPTATVLITGVPIVTNDFNRATNTNPWKLSAQKYNIASSIVLPITFANNHKGTLNIYSDKLDAFDPHEFDVLNRISQNISLVARSIQNHEEKEQLNHLLNERIKELKTLYQVNQILQNTALSVDEVLNTIVGLIPYGWRYVNLCEAKIILKGKEYTTANYAASDNLLHEIINTPKEEIGFIEVVYLNSSESIQEFTFLEEEKNLLRAIGRLIGDYYDWRIIQDELHKSEANLSTIFNNIDIGYILLDLNDTILSFNKSMQNGYAQQNAANLQVGKKFLELISPERKLIKQAAFKEAITQKKAVTYEVSHTHKNNTKFYNISINPVIDDGQVIGLCLSAHDITSRKELELKSQKITTDLIQTNRDLEQFSYIVSHNIRAPLANILGLNALLKDNVSPNDERELLAAISQSAEILDNVVKDVSKILQINKGFAELKEEVFFTEIVHAINESIQNLIEEKHFAISVDFSAVNHCFSIKSYIVSVFQNLIINAIKYTNPNVISTLHIQSELINNTIKIHFKDNGLGIDLKRYGEQLFGLYKWFHFHVDGKGMGLYMVKTQLHSIGGTISVESEPGIGTIFIVSLPV